MGRSYPLFFLSLRVGAGASAHPLQIAAEGGREPPAAGLVRYPQERPIQQGRGPIHQSDWSLTPPSFLPLHLGFMEIEESGATPGPGRGKKRPPSPPTTPDDDESTTSIDDTEWLVSDSGSEEGEDHDNQGKTQIIGEAAT